MATTHEAPLPHIDGRDLPAVLWTPSEGEPPYPVVLVGHGGSGHKRSPRVVEHARAFAAEGVATIALDGPFHGDRVEEPLGPAEYGPMIAAEGASNVVDRMTSDWSAVLDSVDASSELDGRRIGYLGLSMGTRYGLPLLAAHGDRFTAAVLGKFGLTQIPLRPTPDDLAAWRRFLIERLTGAPPPS